MTNETNEKINYLCEIFDYLVKSFETWNYLPAGWVLTHIFLSKKERNRNLMLTLWKFLKFTSAFRRFERYFETCSMRFLFFYLEGIHSKKCLMKGNSEACSMRNINWGNYKVLRSYWGYFFMSPALRCNPCVSDFGFICIWFFFPCDLSFVFTMFLKHTLVKCFYVLNFVWSFHFVALRFSVKVFTYLFIV